MRSATLGLCLLSSLLAATLAHAQGTFLQVWIDTGSDDLRQGNAAFLTVRGADGRLLLPETRFATHAPSNAIDTWPIPRSRRANPATIDSLTLRHDGNPRNGHWFDSYDSWDVKQLTVAWVDQNGSVLRQVYNSAADSALHRGFRLDAGHREAVIALQPAAGEPDLTIRALVVAPGRLDVTVDNVGSGRAVLRRVKCWGGRRAPERNTRSTLLPAGRAVVAMAGDWRGLNVRCLVEATDADGRPERVIANNVGRIVVRAQ